MSASVHSQSNCPICGAKGYINSRGADPDQRADKIEFEVHWVECFTGCRFKGPEHIWQRDAAGLYMPSDTIRSGRRYHTSPEKARKAAMADWNRICKVISAASPPAR